MLDMTDAVVKQCNPLSMNNNAITGIARMTASGDIQPKLSRAQEQMERPRHLQLQVCIWACIHSQRVELTAVLHNCHMLIVLLFFRC